MDIIPNIKKYTNKEDVEMGKDKQIPKVKVFYGENNLTDCMRDILKLYKGKE